MTQLQTATLGAGCFWCVEAIFKALVGVDKVESGYSGGIAEHANYKTVCSGLTDHAEVVQISYDPEKISFETLLQVFFQSHDPTTLNRQGNDIGRQYRSAIFTHSDSQAKTASKVIEQLSSQGVWVNPIVTEVVPFESFYAAENYHNDYFALNGEQPYCQMVVRPKVEKVKAAFGQLLKDNL